MDGLVIVFTAVLVLSVVVDQAALAVLVVFTPFDVVIRNRILRQ